MEEKQLELDDLFSSSDDEGGEQETTSNLEHNDEEQLDYMDDQFIKSLESINHDKLPSKHPSELNSSSKLSFKNVPLELIQAYNSARDEKQFKKAHHLKKQIREYNIKEEMLEKAKLSLSKSIIAQEEEKESGKQSVGLKLLKMMGFENGSGLGKNNQGSVAPISIDKQLDHLMESMDNRKVKPIIGLDEGKVLKREEIEKFKSEMEKKFGNDKKTPLTEDQFTQKMREKHKEQKKKRKLRMALNEDNETTATKKKKEDDEWEEFEDF